MRWIMEEEQILNNWKTYKELMLKTGREGVSEFLAWLDTTDFKYAPASTKYHGSFQGGLLEHTLNVYYTMRDDFANLVDFFGIEDDSLIITALTHDIYKVDSFSVEYRNVKDDSGNWMRVPFYTWDEAEPLGKAEKSLLLALEHGLRFTKIERAMIRNCNGFSETDNISRVSQCFAKCPQGLVLYLASMTTTYVIENKQMPSRYINLVDGRSILECLKLNKMYTENIKNVSQNTVNSTITIDKITYKIAPVDMVVDGKSVIEITNGEGDRIKVYSPYGDGLPF